MGTLMAPLMLGLMLGWSATAVRAQTAPPASAPVDGAALGLQEAIAHALDRQPELRATKAGVDVALGMQRQAAARPNPMVMVERRGEPGGSDSLATVGVAWPLELLRRAGRRQTAAEEVTVARLAVTERERQVAGRVRLQYGLAAAAQREVEVATEVLAIAALEREVARARVQEGAGRALDGDLLEVELRRLRAEVAMATGRAEVALLELRQAMGLLPDEPLRLRDGIEVLVATGRDDAAGASRNEGTPRADATARPDVREAEARVRLADAQIDQARREGRVDVTLSGTYMRMDSAFPQMGFGPTGAHEPIRGQFNYVAAGATVTVPLFNRNQGQVAAAQAARAAADAGRASVRLMAQSEVATAAARDARARQALALYQGDTRDLARRNLEVVRQALALGRGTASDVLMEQRRLLEFEQAYTAALREAWEARAALIVAQGGGL